MTTQEINCLALEYKLADSFGNHFHTMVYLDPNETILFDEEPVLLLRINAEVPSEHKVVIREVTLGEKIYITEVVYGVMSVMNDKSFVAASNVYEKLKYQLNKRLEDEDEEEIEEMDESDEDIDDFSSVEEDTFPYEENVIVLKENYVIHRHNFLN